MLQVAEELTKVDPVRAHARDELGIDMDDHPNPWTAAAASAVRVRQLLQDSVFDSLHNFVTNLTIT